MLQRLYVDNYKCLVNFNLPLQELSLLLASTRRAFALNRRARLRSFKGMLTISLTGIGTCSRNVRTWSRSSRAESGRLSAT